MNITDTAVLSEYQAELDVEIAADHIDALATEQADIEQELVVAEEVTSIDAPPSLSLEEIIMQQGRRSDGEIVVKLTDEQIKAKHDRFHEIYREQVLDNLEFAGLRKDFSLRKKTREADMQQLDNCILRGEETQCVTRWRIAAHKLNEFLAFAPVMEGAKEEAFIFDDNFNLIDLVPLTEMERQMQIEYEDTTGALALDKAAGADESTSVEIHFGENGDIRVTMDESEFEQLVSGADDSEDNALGLTEDSDSAQVLLDRALGNGGGRRNVNYQAV